MTITLEEKEIWIVKSAMCRVKNDNLKHGCHMPKEFTKLLIKIDEATSKPS